MTARASQLSRQRRKPPLREANIVHISQGAKNPRDAQRIKTYCNLDPNMLEKGRKVGEAMSSVGSGAAEVGGKIISGTFNASMDAAKKITTEGRGPFTILSILVPILGIFTAKKGLDLVKQPFSKDENKPAFLWELGIFGVAATTLAGVANTLRGKGLAFAKFSSVGWGIAITAIMTLMTKTAYIGNTAFNKLFGWLINGKKKGEANDVRKLMDSVGHPIASIDAADPEDFETDTPRMAA